MIKKIERIAKAEMAAKRNKLRKYLTQTYKLWHNVVVNELRPEHDFI